MEGMGSNGNRRLRWAHVWSQKILNSEAGKPGGEPMALAASTWLLNLWELGVGG
jgi:hypothetical protein